MLNSIVCKMCGRTRETYQKNAIYCSRKCMFSDEKLNIEKRKVLNKIRPPKPRLGIKWSEQQQLNTKLAWQKRRAQGLTIHPNSLKNLGKQKGETAWNWKGGKPKCIECGRQKKSYSGSLCNYCQKKGARATFWQGGITKLRQSVRHCKQYYIWKTAILKRDNYICQICFVPNLKIEVDHIKALSELLTKNNIISLDEARVCKEIWDISNGRVLCKPCHKQTETTQKLFFKKLC